MLMERPTASPFLSLPVSVWFESLVGSRFWLFCGAAAAATSCVFDEISPKRPDRTTPVVPGNPTGLLTSGCNSSCSSKGPASTLSSKLVAQLVDLVVVYSWWFPNTWPPPDTQHGCKLDTHMVAISLQHSPLSLGPGTRPRTTWEGIDDLS